MRPELVCLTSLVDQQQSVKYKSITIVKTSPPAFHRYQKSQNRLLKVCCEPPTSASLPRVSFFFSFFVAVAICSTNKANKAGSMCR